jgi:selenide,water dikinase
MFPTTRLDMDVLRQILRGGQAKVAEAGASLVGGHSVDDQEPKYGLSVTGVVHPDRVVTNAGARVGDALVLTKPLGTGVLFNAVRSRRISFSEIEQEVLPAVAALNGPAMDSALRFELHACTDITGFGVAGHSLEVARGCRSTVRLEYASLPVYPGAFEMYRRGENTGSNPPNREMVAGDLRLRIQLPVPDDEILFDPQTSGGLLLAVPESEADDLVAALREADVTAAVRVGSVVDGPPIVEIV